MTQIKRSEIWLADLEPVTGSEQGGIRPVIIIQNDSGNKHSPTTIITAMTGQKEKPALPTHVEITAVFLPVSSVALLEQIRTIDKARLSRYLGKASGEQMQEIEKAIAVSLGISYPGGERHE
ncbi:MAG: type II toxin-antitoxin system PemK/MazF family toxin [Clostridiales Family XIII bacterium]|nr:type II toxin-antitoxin system PemK/MazF family toxin [Clostridiales Family XIII bacterium]